MQRLHHIKESIIYQIMKGGKVKRKILIVILVLTTVVLVNAQPPDTTWTERYDNPIYHSNDVGYAATQTSDGGYILASSTWENSNWLDVWTAKTNGQGNLQWNKFWFNYSSGDDEPGYVIETVDGGYIVTGYTYNPSPSPLGHADLLLIKYNSTGYKEWEKIYGEYGNNMQDFGMWIEQTSDSNYIVTGMHSSPQGIWLIKFNQTGNIIWEKTYGEGLMGSCVREVSDGGYIICGRNSGAVLLRVDDSGNLTWGKNLGGSNAQTVFEIPDKKYIILGNKNSDFWLMETDSLGNIIWEKTYGGSGTEDAYAMDLVNDGGYILTGRTYSYGAGESDIWLVRTDSKGDTLWTKTLGGTYSEWGKAVEQTMDNGYMVFGYTELGGSGSDDAWLIKFESDIGLDEISDGAEQKDSFLQNYPNPFHFGTQIRYHLPRDGFVNISIYNIVGEKVSTIVNKHKKADKYSVNWTPLDSQGKKLPYGVYFGQLITDEYCLTTKMLFIK
jgi:hypothetical protein